MNQVWVLETLDMIPVLGEVLCLPENKDSKQILSFVMHVIWGEAQIFRGSYHGGI